MKKTKWFIYTVIVGLIPVILRFLVYYINKDNSSFPALNENDIIAFGLVLNISNINELEDKEIGSKKWKSSMIGLSVVMLILFAFFLGALNFNEIAQHKFLDRNASKLSTGILSVVSLAVSYAIVDRLNAIENV